MTEEDLIFLKGKLPLLTDQQVQFLFFKVLEEYANRHMSLEILMSHAGKAYDLSYYETDKV